jgi:VanZ like family
MALLTYWSGQSNLPIDQPFVANALHGFQHRIAHLIAFGLLGLLARWAFDGLPGALAENPPRRAGPRQSLSQEVRPTATWGQTRLVGRTFGAAILAVALTSAFGAVDEWHQSFVAGRRPAVDDWAVDTASAALALFVYSRLRTRHLEPYLRALSPAIVAAAFVVGIGLAARPTLPTGLSVRSAAHATVQLVRDARDASHAVARRFRTTVAG